MRIEINKYIVADSEICHGKPTFKGTRVMIWQVLEMLEDGGSVGEIVKAFTSLTPLAVRSALSYAVSLTKGGNYVTFNLSV